MRAVLLGTPERVVTEVPARSSYSQSVHFSVRERAALQDLGTTLGIVGVVAPLSDDLIITGGQY